MTPSAPPPVAAWIVRTLAPASQRDTVLGTLAGGFRDQVSSRGPVEARRWYRTQTAEYAWTATRLSAAAVVLAYVIHGGVVLTAPWAASSIGRWFASTWPELLLLLASAHTAWRARSWIAGLTAGTIASCLVTLGAQAAFVGALAIGQPRLFRMGLTWASLRDLIDIFIASSATGAALAAVGGLAGAAIAVLRPQGGLR